MLEEDARGNAAGSLGSARASRAGFGALAKTHFAGRVACGYLISENS